MLCADVLDQPIRVQNVIANLRSERDVSLGLGQLVGLGALLFATGSAETASVGRFLQGAGGVFALVGAIYIATKNFPASQAATLIGATQMFGMAGGSAGQFAVGPIIGVWCLRPLWR